MEMKKISREMSILMSITLSFCLSLSGTLLSGHFTVQGFIISLAASTVISLLIGLFVPMKKIGDGAVSKLGIKPRSIGARCVESLISDLIYTPVITLAMIALAYANAKRNGSDMPFLPTFLKSLASSMVIGFVLIFIFMPLYLKLVLKRHGIGPGAGAPPEHRGEE
ncbi:MAG: hypothetical protein IKO44_02665 [Ruminococcus sp.]|nr:hypothetical protein [Ruminococcus sp.]